MWVKAYTKEMGRRPRKEIRREPEPGAKPDEWDG